MTIVLIKPMSKNTSFLLSASKWRREREEKLEVSWKSVQSQKGWAVFGKPLSQPASHQKDLLFPKKEPALGIPAWSATAGSHPQEEWLWPKYKDRFQSLAVGALGQLLSSSWRSARHIVMAPRLPNMFFLFGNPICLDSFSTYFVMSCCVHRECHSARWALHLPSQSLWLVVIHLIVTRNVPVYPIEYNVPYDTLGKIVPNYPPNKNELKYFYHFMISEYFF